MTPRPIVVTLALTIFSAGACSADMTVRELPLSGSGGGVRVRCYSAPGEEPRPVVVLLHGAAGFAPSSRHYERHAEALAPHGFRTCAVLYYSANDERVMAGTGRAQKSTLFQKRFPDWVRTIHGVVDRLRDLPTTERGTIGILGFHLKTNAK